MSNSLQAGDSEHALGYSDLIRAEKIKSNNNIIKCLQGMSHELLGKAEEAQKI